ncbi:DUF2316 family protein [Micromonosporaceae bacterium Da 78-11]
MSLNDEERARTGQELAENFRLAGSTPDEIRAALDFSFEQFEDTLTVRPGGRPQDVWLLRDHLEDLIRAQGVTPVPYTVLTDEAREAAAVWFPLRRSPGRA